MEKYNLQRRKFLGHTCALTCSFLIPGILQGCNKRDTEVEPESTPSTNTEAPASTNAQSSNKSPATPGDEGSGQISKDKAGYQAQPNGQEKCELCQHFRAQTNTCDLVRGEISAEGWCTLWVNKTG